jgi:hypothetical protein
MQMIANSAQSELKPTALLSIAAAMVAIAGFALSWFRGHNNPVMHIAGVGQLVRGGTANALAVTA